MSTDVDALREEYLRALKENLTENVLGFWFPRCIDEGEGGFLSQVQSPVLS